MAVSPESQPWFHGCISRLEAEDLLIRGGKKDGLYLVRESISQVGSYALSMCYNNKIIHYQAQRTADGHVAIEDGPRFPGPVELVRYHSVQLDGLLCKLITPCCRKPGVLPRSYSGTNQKHIKDAAEKALESMGIFEDPAMQRQMESFIGKVLHQSEKWFHGNISREEAERRLQRCGCINGLYLIRERKAPAGTNAMGLCFNGSVVHYLFDSDSHGQLSIQSGPKFDNLMLAVDHYTQTNDGLLYTLTEPCDVTLFEERRKTLPRPELGFPGRPASRSFSDEASAPVVGSPPRLPTGAAHLGSLPRTPTSPLPPLLPGRPPSQHNPAGNNNPAGFEAIYDSVKLKKSSGYHNQFKSVQNFDLKHENLSLGKELGHGNFGSVLKGTYTMPSGDKIPVAVKSLKSEDLNNPKSEIMHEAKVMMKLDHPYIVRIIGMCQGPSMMLVMELAAEGPLNKYLKNHKTMKMLNILILMLQVAEGMQYLEAQQFVHRDLAARNVLVVNESFVKISDFGMSRAMGAGSDYYRAVTPGKWPLKWYAPECIYFRKFSSKSDVWSYGVTLWEATSYGARPYQGMNGQIIIEKLENEYRLPSPPNVPDDVYKLMKSCWEYEEEGRPSFKSLWNTLGNVIVTLKQ